MILADTSIWIAHLRHGNARLEQLLNDGEIACHSFIIGELACGNIRNRKEILSLLSTLPTVEHIDDEETLLFIEKNNLMGKGLGLIDMYLLASALLSEVSLWTLDVKLKKEASLLGVVYKF
ncbi:MAG: type II toxin-antitoxin system VapC family toxin [bacterium]|nr:type II toxin-antitoxin system VapC family toxin [bacterium]MDD5353700.1 type II toxin-antitoxin system VapC family toxin [bacterium]MDD5755668.1 type II toxin-antitoxin system VapC family toxin [bacterium]